MFDDGELYSSEQYQLTLPAPLTIHADMKGSRKYSLKKGLLGGGACSCGLGEDDA